MKVETNVGPYTFSNIIYKSNAIICKLQIVIAQKFIISIVGITREKNKRQNHALFEYSFDILQIYSLVRDQNNSTPAKSFVFYRIS